MRNVILALALIAGALLLGAPPAHAGRHGTPPDERLERHLGELDLTPAQREKVRDILDDGRAERDKLRARKREAIDQMHALLDRDPPDIDAIMRQAERIGAIKTDAHKIMLRTLLRIREQLSPEQRRELKTIKRRECSAERNRELG